MNITKEYQQKKQQLLKAYDLLKEYGFIPIKIGEETIDEDGINSHKENLLKESFTISVCGQINSGKSTFLNYLLFKDEELLPADDTPWTAKLTTVKYGDKKTAKATFYSEKEWNNLKQQQLQDERTDKTTTYFDIYLRDEVEKSAENGIYDKEVIQKEPLTKIITDLSSLKEYVAKGGIYTPFVSHIELVTDNDLLKDVIIVDTPGINDPNTLRSKVTEEWISKSNAVIYLFYAGAALDRADFEFIDTYLFPHIPSGKIIFAINKADLSGEYKRAKGYVEQTLKTNKDLKDRNLLKNREVYPISSLAALLEYKKNHSELDKDEQWYYDKINKKAKDFLENHGYIENLINAIEKNIMQNKGFSILEKASKTINSICNSKITEIKHKIDETNTIINNIDLSVDELQNKIDEIIQIRIKIYGINDKYSDKILKLFTNTKNQITVYLNQIEGTIKKNYEDWLNNSDTTIDKAIKLTGYKLVEFFKDIFILKFEEIIPTKKLENDIEECQDKYKQEIKKVSNHDLQNLIDYFLAPSIELNKIFETAEKKLRELSLKNLKVNALGFLWTRIEESKSAFMKVVEEQISITIVKISHIINTKIDFPVAKLIESSEEKIITNLGSYEKELEKLKDSTTDKKTLKDKKIYQIKNLKEELLKLENNYSKIQKNI